MFYYKYEGEWLAFSEEKEMNKMRTADFRG